MKKPKSESAPTDRKKAHTRPCPTGKCGHRHVAGTGPCTQSGCGCHGTYYKKATARG